VPKILKINALVCYEFVAEELAEVTGRDELELLATELIVALHEELQGSQLETQTDQGDILELFPEANLLSIKSISLEDEV
jgi:hypothetical protein